MQFAASSSTSWRLIMPNIKFVPQSVTPLGPCPSSELDILRRIEQCGRVAWKSEDKICDGSALKFFNMLNGVGHSSVFEHGNIVLMFGNYEIDPGDIISTLVERNFFHKIVEFGNYFCISGNVRSWLDTLTYLVKLRQDHDWGTVRRLHFSFSRTLRANYPVIFGQPYEIDHEDAILGDVCGVDLQLDKLEMWEETDLPIFTFKMVTDRGIANEAERHRVLSFTQESTRYVNYSGRGLTLILPDEFAEYWDADSGMVKRGHLMKVDNQLHGLDEAAKAYNRAISIGWKPQIARDYLPLMTTTELYVSGRWSHWKSFIKLRKAPQAHPRIRRIAEEVEAYFIENFDLRA
jgi:thymidylate synthase (FAD)